MCIYIYQDMFQIECKESEYLYIVGKNVKWYSGWRKQDGVSSKIKIKAVIWLSNLISGYVVKELKTKFRDIWSP